MIIKHVLMDSLVHFDFLMRCIFAIFMGGMIGLEREYRNKPASFKTHVLICLGATSITYLSCHMAFQGDPGRIAAQIVTGVGFIGGGAILHSNRAVQGLTSAATLWASTALGMLVGAGLFIPAWITALLILTVLLCSHLLTSGKHAKKCFSLIIQINSPHVLFKLDDMIEKFELEVDKKSIKRTRAVEVEMTYFASPLVHHLFLKRLFAMNGVGDVYKL